MPRKDLTQIVVVMDRSGSMQACRSDMEGGLNAFIEGQKQAPGEAIFTLVQFNTTYEFVHKGIPISQVGKCELHPSGYTALLDAVGRAIVETGSQLEAMPESERPGLVVFVIITDGIENASKEFTCDQVRQMISHQQSVYSWKFTFLGASMEAMGEARTMGVHGSAAAIYNQDKPGDAMEKTSAKVKFLRTKLSEGACAQNIDFEYSPSEREALRK